MIRPKFLVLSTLLLTFATLLTPCAANHPIASRSAHSAPIDEGLAAGLDMVLLNSSPLRNGDNACLRLSEGFQLEEVNASLVRHYERQYAARPEHFKRVLERGRKYLFHIINEVERRGLPTEIALVPMVESAFVPTALSRVGAAGLWQFMPLTGQRYGLEQTWWYDGRRDVLLATRAALDYLETLYGLFGNWHLALAAYNWGEGNVTRAIARVANNGQEANFETVRLPSETRHYVPKLLAIRNLLVAPEKFGINLGKFPNRPYFVAVTPKRHIDSRLAAHLAGISVSEFNALNPAFNLPVFAHKQGRRMLLPASQVDTFEANLHRWEKPLMNWKVYTPVEQETIHEVASKTNMNTQELITLNRLKQTTLAAGQPVLVNKHTAHYDSARAHQLRLSHANERHGYVPASDEAKIGSAVGPTLAVSTEGVRRTHPNQTSLLAVAAQPGANHASPTSLANHRERESALAEQEQTLASHTEYVVRQGDTVFSIARRFGVNHRDIVRWNGASLVARLQPGQRVKIVGS